MSEDHYAKSTIVAVGRHVLANEDSIDASIADTARLFETTTKARRDVSLPAGAIQSALDHLLSSLTAQVEGRRGLCRYHATVGQLAKEIGADADTFGPWWPCPTGVRPADAAPAATPLRVAA